MIEDKNYCCSSFLLYRRIVNNNKTFYKKDKVKYYNPLENKKEIFSSEELENYLRNSVKEACEHGKCALALSGGIDSAILAKFMPRGSTAYTFKCVADDAKVIDETKNAQLYAKECGLTHKIIEITWEDMVKYAPLLMKFKKCPIHSIEVQIYMAGLKAKEDGFDTLIYGEGADVNFGGLSNILSREWTVGEFIERYAYVKPWKVLKKPIIEFADISKFCDKNGNVLVHDYLSKFDIIESVNSYINACDLAGIKFIAPYVNVYIKKLDYNRVRQGENKYLIREIFSRLYKGIEIPKKIPMPRPTDQWFKNWKGPKRPEFIQGCEKSLTGDEKWLVWALEKYLNMLDERE